MALKWRKQQKRRGNKTERSKKVHTNPAPDGKEKWTRLEPQPARDPRTLRTLNRICRLATVGSQIRWDGKIKEGHKQAEEEKENRDQIARIPECRRHVTKAVSSVTP